MELKRSLIQSFGKKINDVILFGSQVSGNPDKSSDYDILIVLNSEYSWLDKRAINDVCYKIDLNYDVFLDTQIISLNELNNSLRGKHPVFQNAIEHGYHV